MSEKQQGDFLGGTTITVFAILNVIILRNAYVTDERWYYFLLLTVPILMLEIINKRKDSQNLKQ